MFDIFQPLYEPFLTEGSTYLVLLDVDKATSPDLKTINPHLDVATRINNIRALVKRLIHFICVVIHR